MLCETDWRRRASLGYRGPGPRQSGTMSQLSRPAATLARFRSALRDSPPLLWSFLYFFCLLSGYYVLRPVREAMGASADPRAVFPPAMIDWFARQGVALEQFTLQV